MRHTPDRFEVCGHCGTQNPISRTYCYECTEILSSLISISQRSPAVKEISKKKPSEPVSQPSVSDSNTPETPTTEPPANEKLQIYAISYNRIRM